MVISWRSALLLFLISAALFSSTFLEARDSEIIPFNTMSGYSGTVTLDLPRRVFIGDDVRLSARVAIRAFAAEDPPSALAGRLEAGYEALAPAGRVTVNLGRGTDVELIWTLQTGSAVVYPGNLWLWLISESDEELLLVREFELESRSYFGLDILPVRIIAGLLGLIAILMVGYVFYGSTRKKVTQNLM